MTEPATETEAPKGKYLVLFFLVLVYALNFLDRQIISILAVPIQKEFQLDDEQMGLLGGLAFGLVYSLLAIPVAIIADKTSRVWIMTIALGTWSLFTALCGLAQNYWQLFISRMGVGVGEAGGVAPAYSLIADYFPPKQRATALAMFSFGIPLGAAAGMLYGGLIAHAYDWRIAFVGIGIFGLLLAPIFKMVVKDPPRGFYDKTPASLEKASFFKTLKLATSKPSFWLLSIGAGSSSLVGYGLLFWLPSFLMRSLGMTLPEASVLLAGLLFFGGVTGMWLGGVLSDYLGRSSPAANAFIPGLAFLISIPLYALGVMGDTPLEVFFLLLIPQALGLMWLGPVVKSIQHLGPPQSRTQMSSLFLLINNLIGLGLGPWFMGKVSKTLMPTYGLESLKLTFLASLAFYGLASVLMLLASRRLKKDWVD
jgi:MFS family permease